MTMKTLAGLGLALAMVAGDATAHHSTAMFDPDKTVTLDGVVKEFQWTNPHTWILVMVRGADGKETEWAVEGASPAQLGRRGWKKNSMKPGDKIVVVGHPLKNGEPSANQVRVTVNGTVIGAQ